jgi:hypothetical protein
VNNEQLKTMDPYILISWINMKLRDQFSSLGSLCDDFDLEIEIIQSKLKLIGYAYNKKTNQFVSEQI